MSSRNESRGVSALREEILEFLKQRGEASIGEMADSMGVTGEAVRRQLIGLDSEGLVRKATLRRNPEQAGRPVAAYCLTDSGDHLFPHSYDTLAIEVFAALKEHGGDAALRSLLTAIVDRNVSRWETHLSGRDLADRLRKLLALYGQADDYMSLVLDDPKGPYLIERNCPYQNVAAEFPQLCSVTINTLTRLTGFRVRREKTMQAGHRQCVFRVLTGEPIDPDRHAFEFESE